MSLPIFSQFFDPAISPYGRDKKLTRKMNDNMLKTIDEAQLKD